MSARIDVIPANHKPVTPGQALFHTLCEGVRSGDIPEIAFEQEIAHVVTLPPELLNALASGTILRS